MATQSFGHLEGQGVWCQKKKKKLVVAGCGVCICGKGGKSLQKKTVAFAKRNALTTFNWFTVDRLGDYSCRAKI